jgi:hypothetical protein
MLAHHLIKGQLYNTFVALCFISKHQPYLYSYYSILETSEVAIVSDNCVVVSFKAADIINIGGFLTIFDLDDYVTKNDIKAQIEGAVQNVSSSCDQRTALQHVCSSLFHQTSTYFYNSLQQIPVINTVHLY